MAYFQNRSINLMYLHTALQGIAFHGGESFAFIYLLKAGIPLPGVLLAIGFMYGCRIILRQAVVPFVKRAGLRNGLIFGICLEAATYLIVSHVTGVDAFLVIYLLLFSLSSSFYWTTLHAYIAMSGDTEHRGKQVSATEFINTIVGILAPIMSGLLLSNFPPIVAFSVIAMVMLASAMPFLFASNTQIAREAVVPQAARRQARSIMFTDGLRAALFHYTFTLVLFVTLGQSFAAFGGAMALSGLLGGLFGLFIGRSIDLGHGKKARTLAYGAMGLAGLVRAIGYPLPWTAITANSLAVIAWPMYATVMNGRLYDLAKQSPCTLRYHVVAEGGWDLGTAIGCTVAASLLWSGLSPFWPLSLSLVATVAGYLVLSRSFKETQNHPSSQM
jgi:MFS transporter, DHA1 family, inner membrane transport protein